MKTNAMATANYFLKRNCAIIIFVLIALIVGLVFIKNVGSFSGPDNVMHYDSALAIATVQPFSRPINHQNEIIVSQKWGEISSGCINGTIVPMVINTGDYALYAGDNGNNQILNLPIRSALSSDGLKVCENKTTSKSDAPYVIKYRQQYTPINYLPQAAGLKIGMILTLTPTVSRQLARVANLLVYILLFVVAIKLIPRGKKLLGIIGLLPQSIFLASSLSADAINIAFCAVFIAYVLKIYMDDKKMNNTQIFILLFMGILLFYLKVAYAPLWLLVLALPKKSLKCSRKILLFFTVSIFSVVTYMIWSHLYSTTAIIGAATNNLSLILHHIPQVVFSLTYNTLMVPFRILTTNYTVLSNYGTVINPAVFWIVIIITIIYISKLKLVNRLNNFKELVYIYRLPILAFMAAFLSLFITYGALLLTWNNISLNGFMNIDGFQTRYIMPVLPLFLTIFYLPVNSSRKMGNK